MEDLVVEIIPAGEGRASRRAYASKPLERFTSRDVGLAGEDIACRCLDEAGIAVLERNWRCHYGEADVVCELRRGRVALVEVKARMARGADCDAAPEVAVGPTKRVRYEHIALCYLAAHPGVGSVRFDVVAVILCPDGTARVRHIPNAYWWDD